MAATIHIRTKKAESIFKRLLELRHYEAQLVIPDTPYPERKQTVAEVAAWMEFGTDRSPPRPFLAQSRKQTAAVEKVYQRETKSIIESNRRAQTAIRRVAQKMAALVVQAIDESPEWAKPLRPRTIEKKIAKHRAKPTHPLIETFHLRRSIKWRVTKNGALVEEGFSVKEGQ